jgi:ribosomal protein L30E
VNNKRLGGFLGMARRAGQTEIGFDAVKSGLFSGKIKLVLLAADLSAKTEKELRFVSGGSGVPIRQAALTKEEIGTLLGLAKPVGVLGIRDEGFAAAMQKCMIANQEEEPGV